MNHLRNTLFSGLGFLLACLSVPAACQETSVTMEFEILAVEPAALGRLQALGAAVDFADWSRPRERYVAPAVSRSFLSEPAAVSAGIRSCSAIRFGDEPWGRCEWSWQGLAEAREPTADSWLDLEITLTPDSRAAQEYLLSAMAQNMLPTDGLVAMAQAAERPEGLGTVALLTRSRDGLESNLRFSRANVAFHVRGRGSLAGEVLSLARHLDVNVANQQPLTLDQLLARRPRVDLAKRFDGETLPLDLEVPDRRAVLSIQAWVNGQSAPVDTRRVLLTERKEIAQVEVIAITAELLAGAVESEVAPED